MVTFDDVDAGRTPLGINAALKCHPGSGGPALVASPASGVAWRRALKTSLVLAVGVYGVAHLVAAPQTWLGIPSLMHGHVSRGLFLVGLLALARVVRLAEEPLRGRPEAADAALGGSSLALAMTLALSPLAWWVIR